MTIYDMPTFESIDVFVQPSRELKASQIAAILRLRRESLRVDFPERSEAQIDYFLNNRPEAITNPNRAVGGNAFRKKQSFARAHSISVVHNNSMGHEQLLAHMTVADNASSRRAGIVGAVERQLKLHTTDWELRDKLTVKGRWYWLGLLAVSKKGRDMINEGSPMNANIVDVMIAAGAYTRDKRQPASAYPYIGENLFEEQLRRAGLHPKHGLEQRFVFGAEGKSTHIWQAHWTADSIEAMHGPLTLRRWHGLEEQLAQVIYE